MRRGRAATLAGIFALSAAGMLIGLAELSPAPAPVLVESVESTPTMGRVRFARDIRPILSDRCFQCHGPDPATRKASLRLDLREGEGSATAQRGDSPAAIVPGNPEASEAWRRIIAPDPADAMPPANSHKRPLSGEERALIKEWIAAGAAYEPHWAFAPPVRPAVPQVSDEHWCRNPIDRFVLATLDSQQIAPSPEADRATLLRRVFLDLTGLPPTPEELDAFLADARPDAYERWVDKLLGEEPYLTRHAERMAAPWMDQARYADTCGIHMDAGRQMWLWRDWVIKAYRDNMPFDRFVTEQLAGDLIPNATVEQKIASGFNRNHVTTDEGGAIAEEYLVEYAVDRTMTTGAVFLGLSVGCARCHDHKFDPITMQDFYGLYAFFNSIEEPGLYSQTPDPNRAHEPFLLAPTAEQTGQLDRLSVQITDLKAKLDVRTPEEESKRREFLTDLSQRSGVGWVETTTTAATSMAGATMQIQTDGSVIASGANPKQDEYELVLKVGDEGGAAASNGLRLLTIEALPEPTAYEGRFGRAPNGNAVVTGLDATAISVADPSKREPIRFSWVWADHSQPDGDFDITNLFEPGDKRGWALDAHRRPGGRVAMLMADKAFGFAGGTEVRVKLRFNSIYDQHTLARVRLRVGSISDDGAALLPTTSGRWYLVGPFPGDDQNRVYEPVYGPEEKDSLDFDRNFGFGNQYWRYDGNLADGRTVALADGRNVAYVGRHIYSPVAREMKVSLGSDDGFRLSVNGVEVAQNNTERGVMPDQDKATIPLRAGKNGVVLKIVNTGGAAGYYWRAADPAELGPVGGDLTAALLPESIRPAGSDLEKRIERAWRIAFLPSYKETEAQISDLEKQKAEIEAAVPRTMVMKELEKQRETFVLARGQYDHPDKAQPIGRAVPAALGKLPEGAPANRLGLAGWMTSPNNALLARVSVNRLWELAFGAGLVRTSEDFGQQGEWPSHPELLDWLAVEFREGGGGWDVRHVLRLIVTSSTYRQSSRVRPELRERDPENRLLASYPRRRLAAEQIRDQALYVSGLLVEKAGGPSVKTYQPEGLWQEVAMPQSNTREFKRGEGTDLWRRSLYTYWKRAAPPPNLLTFDAPTREFCTIRRASTSTPLQALVLWNDEQFVEAARVLAQRTLAESGSDGARLVRLFRRCTSREPDGREAELLAKALSEFRTRFAASPDDAEGLLKMGASPRAAGIEAPELAAWTMMASAAMNLYETTTQE